MQMIASMVPAVRFRRKQPWRCTTSAGRSLAEARLGSTFQVDSAPADRFEELYPASSLPATSSAEYKLHWTGQLRRCPAECFKATGHSRSYSNVKTLLTVSNATPMNKGCPSVALALVRPRSLDPHFRRVYLEPSTVISVRHLADRNYIYLSIFLQGTAFNASHFKLPQFIRVPAKQPCCRLPCPGRWWVW